MEQRENSNLKLGNFITVVKTTKTKEQDDDVTKNKVGTYMPYVPHIITFLGVTMRITGRFSVSTGQS